MKAIVRAKPWKSEVPPRKILVMRFQALGDTIITLPYLQSLKQQYPEVELHLLTRKEVCAIPKKANLFSNVIAIGGGRNAKVQFLLTLLKLPWLLWQRYDAVLDLQHHKISNIVRRLVHAKAWAEFDKSSPLSAGERTRQTIEALWRWQIKLEAVSFPVPPNRLVQSEINNQQTLVVLNPAGYCPSRNWPLEYYVRFAELWLKEINPMSKFLLLLLPAHQEKADYLEQKLIGHCINLTGNANQVEAYAAVKACSFMITEDSGLMHMAWTQRIPTLALFSSSRKDWSAPQGERSYCFDSSDLSCGPCMAEICQYHDNRCLTRVTPEIALAKARELYVRK